MLLNDNQDLKTVRAASVRKKPYDNMGVGLLASSLVYSFLSGSEGMTDQVFFSLHLYFV